MMGDAEMTVPKKEMNAGVELLLKRMETHPEEFTEQGKWVQIMQEIHKYAEADESKVLNDALKALMMQKVTEKVLEGLVDPKPSRYGETLTSTSVQNAMPLGGATPVRTSALNQATNVLNAIGTGYTLATNNDGTGLTWANNSLTLGKTTLDESTIEHMKAHLKAVRAEQKAQAQAKQQTIFGKLYNYLGVNK